MMTYYTKVKNEKNCVRLSMFIAVMWLRHRTIVLEGPSSSTDKYIEQFFLHLLGKMRIISLT